MEGSEVLDMFNNAPPEGLFSLGEIMEVLTGLGNKVAYENFCDIGRFVIPSCEDGTLGFFRKGDIMDYIEENDSTEQEKTTEENTNGIRV